MQHPVVHKGKNMNEIDKKLSSLGIKLEVPSTPAANYIPYSIVGNLVFVSGQLPFQKGKLPLTGIVGDEIEIDDAIKMAEICALNILSHLKEACKGDLDKVVKVIKLGGFVASNKNFTDQPMVINGASDLMVNIFGDKGKHSRFAVGVSSLPRNTPVEVEGIFDIKN